MNSTWKIGGGVAAVGAAYCAVSFVPSLLAGTGMLAAGGVAEFWELGFLATALPIAAGIYLLARRWKAGRRRPASIAGIEPSATCACGSRGSAAPVACALDASDRKARAEAIRDLARRSLTDAVRMPRSLRLIYAPEAAGEVRDLVRQEQACCSFLRFDLDERPEAMVLTITAPEAAADAADELFDAFAPRLAARAAVAV